METFLQIYDERMVQCLTHDVSNPPIPTLGGELRPRRLDKMTANERVWHRASQKARGYLHTGVDADIFIDIQY